VRDLSDCAASAKFFQPSPIGCARYLDTPGCSGTIVINAVPNYPGTAGAPSMPDAGLGAGCLVRVR
jgi:hypothetical protein